MNSKKSPLRKSPFCRGHFRLLLLLLAFFTFSAQDVQASHFAGADITYTCVGPNQYLVTLTLYRDCVGIGMPTSVPLGLSSASCGLSPSSQTLTLDTFYEVSQLCSDQIQCSACNISSPTVNCPVVFPGIEVYVYTGLVTFPQACTDWVVNWSSCCRNSAITTLTSTGSMYVEAGINSTVCNSSPTFTTNPTPYFCAGQCYDYNHGAFDPDNDSLLYALSCPLQGAGNCILNVAGLSPTQPLFTNPLNSFNFNQQTGQMTFCTQAGLSQFAVAAVTVFQIANGDTIGYVQRDIQMIVLNSVNCTSPVGSNNPTVFQGGSFDTTSNTFIVCAGETLIFDLVLSDPDGDTIQVDPSNTNLDAVFGSGFWTIIINDAPPFSHDSLQMFVQVIANPANIGVNNFTIGVTDNACPVPGDQILGFNLIIPGVEVTASDTTICPGIAQQIQLTANSFSSVGSLTSGTFGWVQTSGTPVTFSDDTLSNPLVNVPSNTVSGDSIVLTVTFTTIPDPVTGSQCVTTDDVIIYLSALPLDLTIFATDTMLCPNGLNDTIGLSTAISGPGIDLVNGNYNWGANPSSYLSGLSSGAINNPDAVVVGSHGDSVVYTVTYTYGLCVGTDSIKLKWTPGIPVLTALNDSICPGDTTTLFAYLSDTISFSDPSACSTYTVNPIAHAPIAGSGTNVSLTDDAVTGNLPIGFNFEFYCNSYSQFKISSNGFIFFDLSSANNGCCSGQNLPTASAPNNLIALAWADLNPGSGGTINYFTTGTAPNRILVVNYVNVPRFGNINNVTGQILLYEGSNYIDVISNSITLSGSLTTQGIENDNGSSGLTVPGRNSLGNWSATNDAYRFAPGVSFLFGPLTYNWIPGFAVSNPAGSSTDAYPQGTIIFTVEINEDGCIQTDSIEVAVKSLIPPPTVSCGVPFNEATTVLFEWGQSPGAGGWEYSLDSGITWIPKPYSDSSLLITGLTNGDCANILVRATGGAGPCPTNAATYLECCTTPCPMPNTSSTVDLTCNGSDDGILSIDVTPGVLGYHPNYTGTLLDTSGTATGATASGADSVLFTGLSAGVYYAYLIDTFGCFAYSDTVYISEPDSLLVSLDSMLLTTCYADSDGSLFVSAAGGSPGYSWIWGASTGGQTTSVAQGLTVGSYTVTLVDSRGCIDTADFEVAAPFPGPPSLTLSTINSTSCTGNGSATVFTTINMVGNGNNFTFLWSNGANTAFADNLVPGAYTVSVTDENGCQATSTTNISGSASLSVTTSTISPGCGSSDGQVTAVVSGDSLGYAYQWDAFAGSQTTALATGLPVGNYFVVVTGLSNGCVDTAFVSLSNDTLITLLGFNNIDPSCGLNDGSVTVITTGATGPITYNWSGGTLAGTVSSNPLSGLGAGLYTVTVTDSLTNCKASGSAVLTAAAAPVVSFSSVNNPSCNLSNGSITVSGTPGPFSYLWSDGQTTATAMGLASNLAYSCTVTYQGCTVAVPAVSLTNDALQIAIVDKDDIICNGDLSSYANIDILVGDSATTSFAWSNGATTQNIAGMSAGTYTVTATSGSCAVTQSITVVDVLLTINPWIVTAGQNSGTIQLNDMADIDGVLNTNHANAVYGWTQDVAGIVSIADSTLVATMVTGLESGDTWLYFTANAGPCTAMDSVLVTTEAYLGMPTAFSPNGDGINDLFQPAGLTGGSNKVTKFEIYNRWGQLLYSDNIAYSWDGNFNGVPQPIDVYIYVFEYTPDNGAPVEIRGEFTLIR